MHHGIVTIPPLVNMQNDDNQRFKWAVTRALNPVKRDQERISKEQIKQSEELDWNEKEFPTKVKDIGKWEKANVINVNVFGFDEETEKLYTLRLGELKNSAETVNLFLHDDNHYCPITDLSRYQSMQLGKKNSKKNSRKIVNSAIIKICSDTYIRRKEKTGPNSKIMNGCITFHSL